MASFAVREIQCKSVINRVKGMYFDWSINPYRGCRHACVYCYARPTHEYLGMNAADEFQEVIFAKVNAPQVVRGELAKRSWRGDNVVMGTATDPYQQAESKYCISRGILGAFRDFRNPVSITTKSPMVLRDLDLLTDLAQHAPVLVNFTITTLDQGLWRKIEPTTSKPHKRLKAIRTLREHGIRAGVFLSPVLPGLTDDDKHLRAVIEGALDHGAQYVYSEVLRLGPGISEYYLPFLQREFPHLADRYERLYGRRLRVPGAYAQEIHHRIREIKASYGFVEEPSPAKDRLLAPVLPMQLSLFGT